MLQFN